MVFPNLPTKKKQWQGLLGDPPALVTAQSGYPTERLPSRNAMNVKHNE